VGRIIAFSPAVIERVKFIFNMRRASKIQTLSNMLRQLCKLP